MTRSSDDVVHVGDLPVPAASGPVVLLLQQAAAPPAADEFREQAAATAAFIAVSRESRSPAERAATDRTPSPRQALTTAVRGVRVAAAALLASVVLGGGLAAADVLPAPAQRFVSGVLGTVGIPVPSPDDPSSRHGGSSSTRPVDVEGPAGPDQSAAGAASPSVLPERAGQPSSIVPGAGAVADSRTLPGVVTTGAVPPSSPPTGTGRSESATATGDSTDGTTASDGGVNGDSNGNGSAHAGQGRANGQQRAGGPGGNSSTAPGRSGQAGRSGAKNPNRGSGSAVADRSDATQRLPAASVGRPPGP